jgi:hypothetical protein
MSEQRAGLQPLPNHQLTNSFFIPPFSAVCTKELYRESPDPHIPHVRILNATSGFPSVLHFFHRPRSIPMCREPALALSANLSAMLAAAQQPAPRTPTPPTAASPTAQTVYYSGPGVTPPELLPVSVTDAVTGRCKHFGATAVFSAVVDATGVPHNVYFSRPIGNDLDTMALKLALAERFKPGTQNGTSAATADSIEMNLKACIETQKNEPAKRSRFFASSPRLIRRSASRNLHPKALPSP